MTLQNALLLSQCTGYVIAVMLSACAFVPMLTNVIQFRGRCLLFADGVFNEADGNFEPHWNSFDYCGYTLIVSGFALLAALVQAFCAGRHLYRRTDRSFPAAFWDSVLALILSVAVLIDAILVSLGFSHWCRVVMQRFASCETAVTMKIIDTVNIDPSCFYLQIGSVQFGIWASLVIWTLLLVLAIRKVYLYHERENVIVSMARERKRYTNVASTSGRH